MYTLSLPGRFELPGGTLHKDAAPSEQHEILRAILQQDRWFGSWPDEAVDTLVSQARFRLFFDGQRVFSMGDVCPAILVVIRGALQLSWPTEDGRQVIQCYLPKRCVFNLVPMLDGVGLDHDYQAHGTTLLASLDRSTVFALLERDKTLMHSIIDLLCSRSRLLYDELKHQSLSSLRTRLARQIHFFANNYGRQTEQGLEISIKLSQENLAALMSSSRQSINKELSWMMEQGILMTRYNRITVLDSQALDALIGKQRSWF